MKKIKWAIVGLGLQAEKIAHAINTSTNGELFAVISKNKTRAREFAKKFRAEFHYTDLYDLLKRPEVEAVFICSPNFTHAKETLRALAAKKHVLCEKPMALSTKDGMAMVASAKKNSVKLGVGFHLRYHPIFQNIKSIIAAKKIGSPIFIQALWAVGTPGKNELPLYKGNMSWRDDPKKSGGGALMARGVHLFDLIRFVTGDEIKEVSAYTDVDKKRKVDTLALGNLVLRSGIIVTLTTSRRIPYAQNDMHIYGSHGRIITKNAFTTDASGTIEFLAINGSYKKTMPNKNLYQKEVEDFGRAILQDKAPTVSGEDGLHSIEIAEAFLESAKTRKTVAISSERKR